MGVFGGFIFGGEGVGGDVYGPDVDPQAIVVIRPTLIKLNVEQALVVNDDYKNADNYTIVISGTSNALRVRSVLSPNSLTADYIILKTDPAAIGIVYEVSVDSSVRSVTNQPIVNSSKYIGRRTKAEIILRSLPAHYDTRSESNLGALMIAIGMEDELIGGSQNDRF